MCRLGKMSAVWSELPADVRMVIETLLVKHSASLNEWNAFQALTRLSVQFSALQPETQAFLLDSIPHHIKHHQRGSVYLPTSINA